MVYSAKKLIQVTKIQDNKDKLFPDKSINLIPKLIQVIQLLKKRLKRTLAKQVMRL